MHQIDTKKEWGVFKKKDRKGKENTHKKQRDREKCETENESEIEMFAKAFACESMKKRMIIKMITNVVSVFWYFKCTLDLSELAFSGVYIYLPYETIS